MPDTMTIAAIERRLELQAEPDRVWRALTDPVELATWFAESAELDLRPGGLGWVDEAEHGRFAIRVERVEAPSRFAFRWSRRPDTAIDDGASTLVEIELQPRAGGGTLLALRESGFEDDVARSDNVWGWVTQFSGLSEHLAGEPWEAGITRVYSFSSPPERVWQAFVDPARFRVWFGGDEPVDMRAGADGWFAWPNEGRYAVRVEIVEPIRYLAWRWATEPGVALDGAAETLRTEWLLAPRDDGGTDLHLLESGFRGPKNHSLNDEGWDGDVMPALRKALGESG